MASGKGADCGRICKERDRGGGGWGGEKPRGRENQKVLEDEKKQDKTSTKV